MALTNFIPEIWSARLLQNLHKSLVYGQPGIVNRDYEGEIREAFLHAGGESFTYIPCLNSRDDHTSVTRCCRAKRNLRRVAGRNERIRHFFPLHVGL